MIEFQANNTVKGWIFSGGTAYAATSAGTITDTTTWHHIALVRNGNTLYLYIDGSQDGTANVTGVSANDSAYQLGIGRLGQYNGLYFNGWLDEFRISKGVARWTSNFAVPTSSYTSDSYTALLLHMDGTNGSTVFTDSSGGPPPADFTLTASPSTQSISAGSTASTTLTVTGGGGFTGTVSLSVTSGCPPGVTCTVSPTSIITSGTATLSVPTLLSTSGTFSVVVTATSGILSHTVTFTVTVAAPGSYGFNVRAGATEVVVTVSWSGSAAASVTIQGPGGTPSLSESGAVVYDRISYVSGSSTPSNIHRVTFTITPPSSAETWTALISPSGSYTVTIEVS